MTGGVLRVSSLNETEEPEWAWRYFSVYDCISTWLTGGRYHGGRRPSGDNSFHSPTVIPPSALDKPNIVKRYHRRRTTRWGVTARSSTMVTLHDIRFVECRWWNNGLTVKPVVTWRSSASMIPTPGLSVSRRHTRGRLALNRPCLSRQRFLSRKDLSLGSSHHAWFSFAREEAHMCVTLWMVACSGTWLFPLPSSGRALPSPSPITVSTSHPFPSVNTL